MAVRHGEICPVCGMRKIVGDGRYLGLSDEMITAIIGNYISREHKITQRQFCKDNGISLDTYWRVTHMRLKHPKDRERVKAIADTLGYNILAVAGLDK